jgi:hypothetical protein
VIFIQGRRFQILRDIILNIDFAVDHRSVLVNNNIKDAQLAESGSTRESEIE